MNIPEPAMSARTQINMAAIMRILRREYEHHEMPIAEKIQERTKGPYRVLVATILSARTKDETTAEASARLFDAAPTLETLARLPTAHIRRLIFPVGFFRTKAHHLKLLFRKINELFAGVIPQTVEELVQLPGVGRKTANLVVTLAFDTQGICVDVHVHRISNRLGYVRTRTPLETEMALRRTLPPVYWKRYNSYLVSFGQNTCTPRNPKCSACPILRYCNRVGVVTKYAPSQRGIP
jgi:endonuclease III